MTYCSSNTKGVPTFSSVCQFLVNPGIFRKWCTHGRKYKDVLRSDLDWNNSLQTTAWSLEENQATVKATFPLRQQLFIALSFHLTCLRRLAYFFHWRYLMAVELFLNDFELASRCTHKSQCTPCFWCCLVCRLIFSIMDESFLCHFRFSLFATPSFMRASSLFISRTVWNSRSICRPSSALKEDTTLCLLAFFLCTLLRFLNKVLSTFLQYQPTYAISCPWRL